MFITINSPATFNNDITIAANKQLKLKNIVPHGLDHLYFGGETGAYQAYNCYFDMKITSFQSLTVMDDVAFGSAALRYDLTSYNTTVLIDANTTLALECSTGNINVYAPIVNVGQTIGVVNIRGACYIQNLVATGGVINAVGTALQQF